MSSRKTITVSKNGPYIVSGSVSLRLETIGVNAAGESTEWVEGNAFPTSVQYALCRWESRTRNRSATARMPRSISTAPKLPVEKPVTEQAQVLEGPSMQLADAEVLCAFARFCDPHGQVWNEVKDTDDPKVRVQFLQQVANCPSGRLIAVDKHDGESIEPKLPHSIGLIEDPAQKCSGPLWVRGGIALVGADGQAYAVRNRMTLCRCGKSENKPFCNGAHAADPKFRDGLV